jgi:hypothetical protein
MAHGVPEAHRPEAAAELVNQPVSPAAAPWGATVAAVAGLAAAWLAAGSTGLLGHPLRHVMTWAMLAVAALCDRAERPRWPLRLLIVLAGAGVALAMTASPLAPVNVLGAAVLVAALAIGRGGAARRVLGMTALAVGVLGVWRLANTSVATLWVLADRLGGAMGREAGAITGRPLWVGATFAGVDFLVAMAALYVAWLASGPAPRLKRGLCAAVAILVGHLLYLVVLTFAADMLAALPKPPAYVVAAMPSPPAQPAWSWAAAARSLVPWNLPVLAAAIHLLIAGAMFRWTAWPADTATAAPPAGRPRWWLVPVRWGATILLAGALPVVATLSTGRCSLAEKKVVAWHMGYGNWLKPVHGEYGRLSIGMYGMMERYIGSLGGQWLKSNHLSAADLKDADLLILLYPNERWGSGVFVKDVAKARNGSVEVDANSPCLLYTPRSGFRGEDRFTYTAALVDDPNVTATGTVHVTVTDQRPLLAPTVAAPVIQGTKAPIVRDDRVQLAANSWRSKIDVLANDAGPHSQLERILDFVRKGGSLLVLGEHTIKEADGSSRFNDVLGPTGMHVRFDSAMFEVGGWLHSYEALAHPTTAAIPDDRNEFGVVTGASVAVNWPARPLVVGRWGYADPGDEGAGESKMGNHRYDPGEKLGDLVLVAEQPLGRGRIIAFGDTSSMTNGITVGAHWFTSRLLGYLAAKPGSPQAPWRQVLGLVLAAGLVGLLAWRFAPVRLAGAGVVLSLSLVICTAESYRAANVLPDGRDPQRKRLNNLAYIDATHMGAHSEEGWRYDGIAGLEMTLMRDGYLTLSLPELTRERLRRAALLVSIAPLREFTESEIEIVEEFVKDGGVFICTVGYDERLPSRELLARFGFKVGAISADETFEPQPMGFFKAPYIERGSQRAYVRFHSSWPVWCSAPDREVQVLAYGRGYDKDDLPVIILRQIGTGLRQIGRGKVVVIGDTCFAMNKNLEQRGGELFDGMRENADFWRYLLSIVRDERPWLPPQLRAPTQPATQPATRPASTRPAPPTEKADAASRPGKGVRP